MFGSAKSTESPTSQFVPLKQIATIQAGRALGEWKSTETHEMSTVLTGLTGDHILSVARSINIPSLSTQERFEIRAGDLLLARRIENHPMAMICTNDHERATFSDGLIRIRTIVNEIDPIYLLGCILNAEVTQFRRDKIMKRRKQPILIRRLFNLLIRISSLDSQLMFRERFVAALRDYKEAESEAKLAHTELDDAVRAIIQREKLLAIIKPT